jgi:hypothetical protein
LDAVNLSLMANFGCKRFAHLEYALRIKALRIKALRIKALRIKALKIKALNG